MLPSFTLVANANTLSKEKIANIKKILLEIPREVYKTWGTNISYGFGETTIEDFNALKIDELQHNIPQKGNF